MANRGACEGLRDYSAMFGCSIQLSRFSSRFTIFSGTFALLAAV